MSTFPHSGYHVLLQHGSEVMRLHAVASLMLGHTSCGQWPFVWLPSKNQDQIEESCLQNPAPVSPVMHAVCPEQSPNSIGI